MMTKLRPVIFGMVTALTLSACNSGGGSGNPESRPVGQVEGKAVDAILIGSTVRAYEWDRGEIVSGVIDEAITDETGAYSLAPQYPDSYLLLKATGGHYVEEATGTRVELAESQALTALVRYESGRALTTHITIPTHWAACQAEWRAKTQGNNSADAVDLSNDLFSTLVGVPIRDIEPLNITDPNNASPTLTAGLQYGIYTAALSGVSRNMAEASGQPAHELTSTTTIHLAQIGCNDIRADGKLDGQGYTPATPNTISQLSYGTVQLSPEIWRTDVAQEMLAMAASDINRTGLNAHAFFNVADSLAKMDSSLFDNIAPVSADLSGPSISLDVPENTYLSGNTILDFEITDPLGIQTIDFYVDNVAVASGSEGATAFAVNTTGFSDDLHEVRVVAVDNAGNTTTFTRNFNFDNAAPTLALTSPLLTNSTSYTATGSFTTQGAVVNSVTVNGVAAVINSNNNTWSATVPLNSGNNTLTMIIQDAVGNSSEIEQTVGVDLVHPIVSSFGTNITFSTFQGQLNLCTGGDLTHDSAASNPICLSTDNVSLNGASVSVGLENDGFAVLGYSVDDPQGAGVFTDRQDLTIEYRFEQNDMEIIPWSPAPIPNPNSAIQSLPMVTEYLGETWHQIDNQVINLIQIRVTDAAGNSTTTNWRIQVEVLIPPSTVNTSVLNSNLIVGTGFASRTSVDGQLLNVEYTLENPSGTAYYISMDDSANHNVAHINENKVRVNKVRINTNEQWRVKWASNTTSGSLSAFTWSDWEIINSIVHDNQTISPSYSATGAWQYPSSDTINTTNGNWVDQNPSTYCNDSVTRSTTNNLKQYHYNLIRPGSTLQNSSMRMDNNVACVAAPGLFTHTWNMEFQRRNYKTVEYETGYPRNVSSYSTINYPMQTERITVFNDSLGQEISPIDSWFRVPPRTTIKIIKAVRTPALQHFYDADVSSGNFTSYTTRRLDSSTTWQLDTDLTITRVVDPGDPSRINSVTHTTETIGQGIESYTISR